MRKNINRIIPTFRNRSPDNNTNFVDTEPAGVSSSRITEASVSLALRAFGADLKPKIRLDELRLPTEDELESLVNKYKDASMKYYENGSGYITDEEWLYRRRREDAVNEARQQVAAAYGDVLTMLGQGHIVDAGNRK